MGKMGKVGISPRTRSCRTSPGRRPTATSRSRSRCPYAQLPRGSGARCTPSLAAVKDLPGSFHANGRGEVRQARSRGADDNDGDEALTTAVAVVVVIAVVVVDDVVMVVVVVAAIVTVVTAVTLVVQ